MAKGDRLVSIGATIHQGTYSETIGEFVVDEQDGKMLKVALENNSDELRWRRTVRSAEIDRLYISSNPSSISANHWASPEKVDQAIEALRHGIRKITSDRVFWLKAALKTLEQAGDDFPLTERNDVTKDRVYLTIVQYTDKGVFGQNIIPHVVERKQDKQLVAVKENEYGQKSAVRRKVLKSYFKNPHVTFVGTHAFISGWYESRALAVEASAQMRKDIKIYFRSLINEYEQALSQIAEKSRVV